jgi:hypothetical protein
MRRGTENAYTILTAKSEVRRLLGRRWLRRGDIIKVDLEEMGWKDVDWIHLLQDGIQ